MSGTVKRIPLKPIPAEAWDFIQDEYNCIFCGNIPNGLSHKDNCPFVNARKLMAAWDLWQEWFEKDGEPQYASEQGGDVHCFFCRAWLEVDEHESDCIYLRAKALIEGE